MATTLEVPPGKENGSGGWGRVSLPAGSEPRVQPQPLLSPWWELLRPWQGGDMVILHFWEGEGSWPLY